MSDLGPEYPQFMHQLGVAGEPVVERVLRVSHRLHSASFSSSRLRHEPAFDAAVGA